MTAAITGVSDPNNDPVTTTNATQTLLYEFDVPADSVSRVAIEVFALDPANSDWKVWQTTAVVQRAGSGAAALIGSILDLLGGPKGTGPTLLWALTVDVNGTKLRLRVTGAASRNIQWLFRLAGYHAAES